MIYPNRAYPNKACPNRECPNIFATGPTTGNMTGAFTNDRCLTNQHFCITSLRNELPFLYKDLNIYILTDFKNATPTLSALPLRLQDVSEKYLKSTISLLYFNTKNEMPVSVINAIPREINGYPKLNKNKLHNGSMGTKKILNGLHDFWKERSKHKRMLLAGVYLREKRGSYVCLTFIKQT